MVEKLLSEHLDMVVGFRVDDRGGVPPGPPRRQLDADPLSRLGVRPGLQGHPVRLPGVLAPLRKSFPVLSDGFEIETELSVHALELALPVAEIETPYYARPEGSVSKLNTWRDGFRILGTILKLYRAERPLRFFTAIGIFLVLVSVGLAIPSSSPISRPAWCRGCRRRSCRPGW